MSELDDLSPDYLVKNMKLAMGGSLAPEPRPTGSSISRRSAHWIPHSTLPFVLCCTVVRVDVAQGPLDVRLAGDAENSRTASTAIRTRTAEDLEPCNHSPRMLLCCRQARGDSCAVLHVCGRCGQRRRHADSERLENLHRRNRGRDWTNTLRPRSSKGSCLSSSWRWWKGQTTFSGERF